MTSGTDFRDWSAKAVEQRVLEAAETLALCPRATGPQAFGNSMPEPLRRQSEAYAPTAPRYRRKPSADAMDRMEQCWSWINALEHKADRRLLYDWARTRIGRGRSVKLLALEEGISDRTLRREINRICRTIAKHLNESRTPQPSRSDGDIICETEETDSTGKFDRPHEKHWRAEDARPVIDRTKPAVRTVSR